MSLERLKYLVGQGILLVTSRWKARRLTTKGARLRIYGRLFTRGTGEICIEERVTIDGSHLPVELATFGSGVLRIGARTYINSGTSICASQSVSIGRDCAIGNYCLIMDTDFHSVEDHTQLPKSHPVTIEDNVWIASRVTVLKGVTIGHHAVVAAGAVVTKDVAPYTLVGGIPARLIRTIQEAPVA